MRAAALVSAALLWPAIAAARDGPSLPPEAERVVATVETPAAVKLPVTPWQAGEVQTIRAEGTLRREVWQVPLPDLTTQRLMAPIRAALEEEGYAVLLACEARECGGFEFRFATDALPPPEMYVDLGDYRFLSAQRSAAEGESWRAVMVSVTDARGFVQISSIDPPDEAAAPVARPVPPATRPAEERPALGRALEAEGHTVLWDLAFETGAVALGPGAFDSLTALADWMRANPDAEIALVGHTDTEGGLAPNIDLSRRRAAAVRERLVEAHGIAADRLSAEGVGYLAPLASNATAEGREANRRVEAVLVGGI